MRPDLIESGSSLASTKADAIKTHHNDTELVRALREKVHVFIILLTSIFVILNPICSNVHPFIHSSAVHISQLTYLLVCLSNLSFHPSSYLFFLFIHSSVRLSIFVHSFFPTHAPTGHYRIGLSGFLRPLSGVQFFTQKLVEHVNLTKPKSLPCY